MKVLVCGDRNWDDYAVVKAVLDSLNIDLIISGGNGGADKMAERYAKETSIEIEVHYADWKRYGKGAGPIRNMEMLNREPDLVVAFHKDLSRSKGTKNCVYNARRMGIDVMIYSW